MQLISKLEAKLAASMQESQILREQISSTEEALQDACERLRLLEIESNEHRNEAERQQLEAKMEFEERIRELSEKLQRRENECNALRACIAKVKSQKQQNRTESQNEDMDDDKDDDDEEDGSDPSHEKEKNTKKKDFGRETIVMKWLRSSDCKMKEGSMDTVNAICNNEPDSSDEQETISPVSVDKNIKQRYARLGEKLNSLKHQLKHIEEGVKEYQTEKATVKTESHVDDVNGEMEEEEKGGGGGSLQMKLMKNVNSLNDAVEEVFQNYQQLREAIIVKEQHSPPTAPATEKIEKVNSVTKASVKSSLPEINEVDDEHDSEEEDGHDEENDVIIVHLEAEVEELKMKLNDRNVEVKYVLEILKNACDSHEREVGELIEQVQQQERTLRALMDEIGSTDGTSSESGFSGGSMSDTERCEDATSTTAMAAAHTAFEQQMREDLDALNNSAVQREEELIAYKESLEESQKENAKLRNDLQRLKDQQKCSGVLMKALMPIGAVAIAVVAYLSIKYF